MSPGENRLGEPNGRGTAVAGLVTVVIPVFNRSVLVLAALESVLRQSHRPIEVLVVDDGSTDGSGAAVESWADLHRDDGGLEVRVIRQPQSGAAEARNRGMAESSGEFVQFLDSDDCLHCEKIAVQVEALGRDPQAAYAYGPVHQLEKPERVIYCQTEMDTRRMLIKQVSMPIMQTASPLHRRETLGAIGVWNQSLTPMDDWEYYSRLPVLGLRGVFTPRAVVYLRQDVEARLSWRGEPARLDQYVGGRVGLLRSMQALQASRLKDDPELGRALAWQFLSVASVAVRRGWTGDDLRLYREAMEVAPAMLSQAIRGILFPLRRVTGRRLTALAVAVPPWLYWRMRSVLSLPGRWTRRRALLSTVPAR